VSENLLVDVLLAVAVGAELLACVGVVVARTVYDRLHFVAAGSTVGPLLILAALLVREGLSSQGLESIVAVVLLFFAGPVLVHVIARAARQIDVGTVEARPEDKAAA
jgi:monovalent cation/proton antiporter MnhG/PhaG subunit